MILSRRTFLVSTAAALGLSLVPKRLRAAVKPVTVPWYEFNGIRCNLPCSLIRTDDGPRMGLIDKDHVPEGTKLEEWSVHSADESTGYAYFADAADDVEQWWIGAGGRLFCSDSRPDMHLDQHPNLHACQAACYRHKVHVSLFRPIRFAYTGPHPIYSRLFPVPTTS